jgi:tryptophan 7-halogenase
MHEGERSRVSEQARKRVIIAGGGTAGWLTAAALARQLGELLEITLVESSEFGTVGVGESTIPTARAFHSLLGIDEAEFMAATGSSFKLGISFENWTDEGSKYFHSFGEIGPSTWMGSFIHFWLHARERGIASDLGDYCLELSAACANRFSFSDDRPINYAYHLDAADYARYLKVFCTNLNVTHIDGQIGTVHCDSEGGNISSLGLKDGRVIEGDFFVDCTGMKALLIGEALGVGYTDWSEHLPTNRAIAVQSAPTSAAVPYTRAIAHSAGWRWQIPLQHRVGNGLVYCDRHLSDDEASNRLLDSIDGEPLTEPRVIRFKAGTRPVHWKKNCVAIGLSSGFVEPLESTSIHLIMIGVTRLLQLFPFGESIQPLAQRYNALADREIEQIRDFIILHYRLNNRQNEKFWDAHRCAAIPASLAERIALFTESAMAYQGADELFRVDSWVQVMMGQGITPKCHHQMAKIMPEARLKSSLDQLRQRVVQSVAEMSAHDDFLRQYCAR